MPQPQTIVPNYLHEADLAVQYVESQMRLGAANRAGDVIWTLGDSASCVQKMRQELSDAGAYEGPISEVVVKRALAAQAHGCGNCGEQSALAFLWLFRRNIRPLEWMQFTRPADHAFVVIGRDWKNSFDWDVPKWGPLAVVCDPWKRKAYPAIDLKSIWPGCTPTIWYRVAS